MKGNTTFSFIHSFVNYTSTTLGEIEKEREKLTVTHLVKQEDA